MLAARYLGSCDAWFRSADGSRLDAARLVVPGEDFRDAAVRHAQLARYIARSDAQLRQFDDPHADAVGQRAAVDENAAQLIHFAVLRH